MGPRNHALRGGAQWRNLNTIEPPMYGGDALCYEISLTTSCNIDIALHIPVHKYMYRPTHIHECVCVTGKFTPVFMCEIC